MDNIGNELIFVERKEISPMDSNTVHQLYTMDWARIVKILRTNEYFTTSNQILAEFPTINRENFRQLIKRTVILKNNDAINVLSACNWRCDYSTIEAQELIDLKFINYYFINYFQDGYTYFIIVTEINIAGVNAGVRDQLILKHSPGVLLKNYHFIRSLLALFNYHYEETNNVRNESDENFEISSRISSKNNNYLSQKMISQPDHVKTPLKKYQLADVNWMINREQKSSRFILEEDKIINWGCDLEFNLNIKKDGNPVGFIPKRTIHNYPIEKLNQFDGGISCSEPGLGKTLEHLTLCLSGPTSNLIIVPNHLIDTWTFEYAKHIIPNKNIIFTTAQYGPVNLSKSSMQCLIVISTFDTLTPDLISHTWDRVAVDEFHELFSRKDNLYEKICSINSRYKWAITATPFVNSDMIYNMLNFIARHTIKNKKITKCKMYLDIFTCMFRRNTKESTEQENLLPSIEEIIIVPKFSEKEAHNYNSLGMGLNSNVKSELKIKQGAFCINPNMYFMDQNGIVGNFVYVNELDSEITDMHRMTYEKNKKEMMSNKKSVLHDFHGTTIVITDLIDFKKQILKKFYKNQIKMDSITYIIDELNKDDINDVWSYFMEEDNYLVIKDDRIVINKLTDDDLNYMWTTFINPTKSHTPSILTDIKSIHKMELKVNENKSAMNYYETKLKEINDRMASLATINESGEPLYGIEETKTQDDVSYEKLKDTTECLICLDTVSVDCTMLQCGHIFCRECIMFAIDNGMPKCPTCKMTLKNTKLYSPILKKKISPFNDLINAYGTKIAHLINLCKTKYSSQKIVLYSHSPSLIKNIVDILNNNEIKTITPKSQSTISNTIKQFRDDSTCRIMVLSSEFNASGLTLTFASICIILQPLEGSYSMRKQIEAQLVGRLHRIGQINNVILLRLIISNSIESEIEMENKIIDMIYQTDEQCAPFALKANKRTKIDV